MTWYFIVATFVCRDIIFLGRNNKILCRDINLWPRGLENVATWKIIFAIIEMSQNFIGPINREFER